MHQIWISYFSRHFYEVNLILVLTQIHWMNFDETNDHIITQAAFSKSDHKRRG